MEGCRLAVNDLACRRGDRLLFRGLSFELNAGEALQVAGPNGTGKSSLLRIVAGLLRAVRRDGRARGDVALLDERSALDEHLPLGRALAFWGRIDGGGYRRRQPRSDLGSSRCSTCRCGSSRPASASAPRCPAVGQRRRALWLLDEPLNGLDAARRRRDFAAAGWRYRRRGRRGDHRLAPAVRVPGPDASSTDGLRAMRVVWALLAATSRRCSAAGGAAGRCCRCCSSSLVAMLFPFAVGPDPVLLARTGGGIVWVAALLAAILPLDRLLAPDLEQGFFDQFAVRGIAEEAVVAVRLLAHWLSFGPPLMLAALPAAALLGLPRRHAAYGRMGPAGGHAGPRRDRPDHRRADRSPARRSGARRAAADPARRAAADLRRRRALDRRPERPRPHRRDQPAAVRDHAVRGRRGDQGCAGGVVRF